jgi:hypothetical protein
VSAEKCANVLMAVLRLAYVMMLAQCPWNSFRVNLLPTCNGNRCPNTSDASLATLNLSQLSDKQFSVCASIPSLSSAMLKLSLYERSMKPNREELAAVTYRFS